MQVLAVEDIEDVECRLERHAAVTEWARQPKIERRELIVFTAEVALRDRAVGIDEGLNVLVGGLTPNLAYSVRLWSYDNSSNPARISDWFVNNGLTPVVAGYSFTGSILPTDNNSDTFSFLATADASGRLLLSGRAAAAVAGAASNNTHNVFLNGLQLTATAAPVPEPATLVLAGIALCATVAWRRRPL